MEKETKKQIPKWAKLTLFVSFIFYIWYLISTLLIPLSSFIDIPDWLYLTLYKMIDFPPAIFGFVICVSLISTIVVILEFNEQKSNTKLFLIEGVAFTLYFIIPIIATIFLLTLIIIGLSSQIPTETGISYFLRDLFLFASILFLITAVVNIATNRIIEINKKRK